MGPTNPAFSRNSKPPPLGGGVFTIYYLGLAAICWPLAVQQMALRISTVRSR
jgi:hypothetical protein